MEKDHIKNIKRLLRKRLKKECPHYKSLTKKQKRNILSQILNEIIGKYDINQPVNADRYDLCNIDRIPDNIYTLDKMDKLYKNFNSGILPFKLSVNKKLIKDPELLFIHNLCDWPFVNELLAPKKLFT